ncbi:MAG TPA: penicillin-binding transpeptidase domain-containing protein, partial [Solirubrobacteraceae bacterium]|nr:penicillin-binding transpeptidase domain-containing protein [Solirubrobacteraceae bacterium]
LTAWQGGEDPAAAELTDRPAEAAEALAASRKGLDGATLRAQAGKVSEEQEGRASAPVTLRWTVPGIGPWTTRTRIALVKGDGDEGWKVRWSPTVIHRDLTPETRLGTAVFPAERGAIVDRESAPIVQNRQVVDLAVQTSKVRDAGATAARLAQLLDLDADALEQRIADAPKGRYLAVVSLRKTDFDAIAEELAAVPGVSTNQRRAPLAPTKGFARALLGAVGPATAEQVAKSEGRLKAGDETGQWGLQARFDAQLRGTASREIVTRDVTTGGLAETLFERKGRDGMTLRTTLDREVQAAAERALGDTERKAALVAVQPSSGDVLAVANRPTDQAYDRALEGLYPPGSTFKIVSTAALLRDGLDVDSTVDCPKTRTVNGRSFRNFEGGAAGAVPFRTDFAQSCNTAFVGLAGRLGRDDLTRVARDFGLGRNVELPLTVGRSKVPAASDPVARAAMMIGQDKIVASPLAMAGVAATVADGRWRAPRLIRGSAAEDEQTDATGDPLPQDDVATLRQLMRAVVTGGTGTALASVPGEPRGKSGTAEYGGGDPPPTHAWFVAYRGDVAIAVLVEGGQSGGRVAAPIAAKFFTALGAG